jgi:ubiquinone/menaquinone biosynthesis C-methylase UbiE
MLLLAGDTTLQQVLSDEFGCDVTLFDGDMRHLPYDDAQFDSVIVARPITSALLPITRELARVVKLHGTLGMIVLHAHADYAIETMQGTENVELLGTLVRPAAAYRAVLAESGFTAFVSTPRQAEVLRNVRDAYRQHLLQPVTSHEQAAVDVPAQALRVLANEGIGVTLITAEKAL